MPNPRPALGPHKAIAHLPCASHTRSQADNLAFRLRQEHPHCFCTRITLPSGQEVYLIAEPLAKHCTPMETRHAH